MSGTAAAGRAVADAESRWTVGTGGPVRSSPTVVGGTVYVGSDDGSVYALFARIPGSSEGSRNRLRTLGYQRGGGDGSDGQVDDLVGERVRVVSGALEGESGTVTKHVGDDVDVDVDNGAKLKTTRRHVEVADDVRTDGGSR